MSEKFKVVTDTVRKYTEAKGIQYETPEDEDHAVLNLLVELMGWTEWEGIDIFDLWRRAETYHNGQGVPGRQP